LELDPNQPVALAAHAAKLFFADGEYQSALDIFHDLLKRFPNNDAVVSNAGNPLSAIGRHDLALRLYQMRVELDPLSPRTHTGVGQQLFFLGRFAEAEKAFTRSRALGGRVYPWSVSAAMYQGDSEGAERYLEMVMADWPDLPWMGHMAAIDLANIEGDMVRAGHHAHSLIDLAKTTFVPEGPKSVAYYVLGDASWVTALSQSLADREYVTLLLLRVPSVPKLSQEPEYQELLRSVGLDDESVAELHVQEWPL
jgi:tetratricopeptide (TPR) repeat protein